MWKQVLAGFAQQALRSMAASPAKLHNSPKAAGSEGPLSTANHFTEALGRNMRDWSRNLAQPSGPIGASTAAAFVASQSLDKAGRYLESEGLSGSIDELNERVKKHPLPFIAMGVLFGIAIGHMMKSPRS